MSYSYIAFDNLLWYYYLPGGFPHTAAKPFAFRRGTTWPSSVNSRELGRLRHSVELVLRVHELTVGASAVPRESWNTRGRSTRQLCQPTSLLVSSTIVDHHTHITISATPVRGPGSRRQ